MASFRDMIPDRSHGLINRRWTATAVTAVILCLSLFSASGLRLEEDVLALLPADPEISHYRKMLQQFNPMNAMLLEVRRIPDHEETLWFAHIDSLIGRMQESGQFKKVLHRFSLNAWTEALDCLKKYRPVLYSDSGRAMVVRKTAYDSILSSLAAWEKTLMESPAPFVIRQFKADPLRTDAYLLRKLQTLSGGHGSITVHQGRLMSSDLEHALIIAYPHVKATDSRGAAALIAFMDSTIAGCASLDIAYISGHRFSLENSRRIQADIKLTLSIALGAIIILAFFIFARPWLVFLTILPALFGTGLALGIMRWITPSLSAIAVGSGALLIGITVDYSIHLLFHTESRAEIPGLTHRNRLRKPLLLSAATTGAAFGTLCLSTLPGYRQLGGFAVTGIAGALLCVLYLLPHIITRSTKRLKGSRLKIPSLLPRFFAWAATHRRLLLVLLAVITAVMIPGLFRLKLEGDLQKLNASTPEIESDWQRIQTRFKDSMEGVSIAVFGDDMEAALQTNESLMALLDDLHTKGLITHYQSVSHLLPSLDLQNDRIAHWQALFSHAFRDTLQDRIARAAAALRMHPSFFEPFLAQLLAPPEPLVLSNIESDLLNDILDNQISQGPVEVSILTTVTPAVPAGMDTLRSILKGKHDITVYSGPRLVSRVITVILGELKRIGFLALMIVAVILLVLTRRIKHIAILLAPLLLSLAWTFGIMGWASLSINLINAMVAVFIFGLVIDYCIFLYHGFTGSHDSDFTHLSAGAILVSALTTGCGMGALVFARHPVLHTLGLSALIGIISGVLAVFIIIPLAFQRQS